MVALAALAIFLPAVTLLAALAIAGLVVAALSVAEPPPPAVAVVGSRA